MRTKKMLFVSFQFTANVLSFLNSDVGSKNAIKSFGVSTKRGKRTKLTDEAAKLNSIAEIRVDENKPLPQDLQPQPRNMVSPEELNNTHQSEPLKNPTPISNAMPSPPKSNTPPSSSDTNTACPPISSGANIEHHSTPIMLQPNESTAPVEKPNEQPSQCSDEVNPIGNSTDDTAGTEGSIKSKPKNKKKRRTTRSLSPVPSAKRRCSDRFGVLRRQMEALVFGNVEFSNRTDEEIHRLKLDMLEQIVLHTNESSLFFAIAGKKLFEPEGSIQKKDVKRLARNAGSIRASSIAYETPFEVGESTTCHYWRTMALRGSTFEDFMFSLKFFNEHMDRSV